MRSLGQATNVRNASATVVTSSEGSETRASGNRTFSTVTFATSGERGTLCHLDTLSFESPLM